VDEQCQVQDYGLTRPSVWDVHPKKTHNTQEGLCFLLLVGGDIAAILLMTSIGI